MHYIKRPTRHSRTDIRQTKDLIESDTNNQNNQAFKKKPNIRQHFIAAKKHSTPQRIDIVNPNITIIRIINQDRNNLSYMHNSSFIVKPNTSQPNTPTKSFYKDHRSKTTCTQTPNLLKQFRNPELGKKQIRNAIQKRVTATTLIKQRIFYNLILTSVTLFDLIEKKTIILQDIQIDQNYIVLQIQSPANKGFGLFRQSQKKNIDEAMKLLKGEINEYAFGKTRVATNSISMRIAFQIQTGKVDPDSKFEVLLKKDGIKRLIGKFW